MPLSSDPAKRAIQLANLQPGAGAWAPGDAPALVHGERSRQPQRSVEWSPAVERAIEDLQQRVGEELRHTDGEVHAWALPSIEAVAIQRIAAWRAERHVSALEAKGRVNGEEIERLSRVAERYHRALEREALTLRSRLDAKVQTRDLAKEWAADA